MKRTIIYEADKNHDALDFFREHGIDYTDMTYQIMSGKYYMKYNIQLHDTDLLALKIKSPNLIIMHEFDKYL